MVEARERIRAGQKPVVDGDGTEVQDCMQVGDVARAKRLAMTSAAGGEGMNIAPGKDTSQNRVIAFLLAACTSDPVPEAPHRPDPACHAAADEAGLRARPCEGAARLGEAGADGAGAAAGGGVAGSAAGGVARRVGCDRNPR
jgi:nucleoside-diphosphate-sugar epimerase